jgi:hypothetical protein
VTGVLQEMMGGTAITVETWFPNLDYTKNSFAINAIYWTNFDPSTVFVFSAWSANKIWSPYCEKVLRDILSLSQKIFHWA